MKTQVLKVHFTRKRDKQSNNSYIGNELANCNYHSCFEIIYIYIIKKSNYMKNTKLLSMVVVLLSIATSQLQAQKIGLLLDSYITDRWYIDQKLFSDKVKELGGQAFVEVGNGDTTEQVRLGKKLIDEGVRVLAIVPTDSRQSAKIAAMAKAANVKVIAYDRMILSNDVSIYISYDNEKVGMLQAKYVVDRMPKGNIIIINGPESDNNAIQFGRGQRRVLDPYVKNGSIKIIGDFIMSDWGELGALMKMDEFFITAKQKPNAILAANDALANGATQSLPAELAGKVIVTGQDADLTGLKNIISGRQSMTIYKPIKPLAHMAADVAIKLAKGEQIKNTTKIEIGNISVNAILLEPIVVDKLNYKDTVVKDGHAALSQILDK
jgi:D-xylose transport system substrate-binding protein